MITLRGVRYTYPDTQRPALDGIDLHIAEGEFCAVVGPNGAGKSTLCYAIGGFAPHYFHGTLEGEVEVAKLRTLEHPLGELVQRCGLLFGNPLNQITGARFTVREELAFGLENLGVPRAEMLARIDETLALLGIEELAERSPFELSGGQQQRVALASILVMRPQVLLLDEPTAQLDPAGSREVFEAIGALSRTGVTVLLVEHKPELIAQYARRVILLREGRVALDGTPRDVLAAPELVEAGVLGTQYTEVAQAAQVRDLWSASLPLPVTLEQAAEGFVIPHASPSTQSRVFEDVPSTHHAAPFNPAVQLSQSGAALVSVVVDRISFSYRPGLRALYDVSLRIDAGETVALVGQNGAGKTTLARHLNGLLQPTTGRVLIGDWDTRQHTVARLARRVGYVFQHPDRQIFKRTVRDEVAFGPRNLGFDPQHIERAVMAALEATHLTAFADRHPHDLLLSQRKYVAVASVLAMETPVIVLDEPTAGQDAEGMRLMSAIIKLLRVEGRTVIMISHDIDFIADQCDRCIVLQDGHVLADGPVKQVLTQDALLAQSALEPPQLVRLAQRLHLPPVWQTEAFLHTLTLGSARQT